jgi:hypothetical protein
MTFEPRSTEMDPRATIRELQDAYDDLLGGCHLAAECPDGCYCEESYPYEVARLGELADALTTWIRNLPRTRPTLQTA